MRPELNNSLKERFFALYWGQKVFKSKMLNKLVSFSPDFACEYIGAAILRPISSITDEEAIQLAKIPMELDMLSTVSRDDAGNMVVYFGDKDRKVIIHGDASGFSYYIFYKGDGWVDYSECISHEEILSMYDYLRSRSFALPWMGYSVEELEEAGFIRLQEGSTDKQDET